MSGYTKGDFFSLESRQAFIAREAKLRGRKDWPIAHWYNDEAFCELYRHSIDLFDQLAARTTELEKMTALTAACVTKGGELTVENERLRMADSLRWSWIQAWITKKLELEESCESSAYYKSALIDIRDKIDELNKEI